jgi:hypothetical protein
MKCPVCWAEKAYVRKVQGWKSLLYQLAWLVPLKCHHCYHKFVVSWFSTIGRTIHPPKIRRTAPVDTGPAYAARSRGGSSARRTSRKPAHTGS